MLWIFIIASVIYGLFLIFLIKFWNKETGVPLRHDRDTKPFVSVVIAVRNEEVTIGCLLDGLSHQDYPADGFEVIVVDDGSMDDTLEIVQAKGRHLSCELTIGVTGAGEVAGSGKKAAITKGIELARGEMILVTDGDCRVGVQWISAMVEWFLSHRADFLAGPVGLKAEDGFWYQWQILEFASLTGTGAAFINAGTPLFCHGANMAFRRAAFYSVDGYSGNERIASGDDVFLMQKISAWGGKVVFVKDSGAIVQTRPQTRWGDFFHQRNRWAGKWYKQQNLRALLLPVFLFLYYLLMITALILALAGSFNWGALLILILIKVVLDYIFLKKVMNFLNNKMNIGIFVLSSLAYAFYTLVFGITANLTGFRWKGRKYRR